MPRYGSANAITEIDVDLMDAITVKEDEISWPGDGTGTLHTAVAKLDA